MQRVEHGLNLRDNGQNTMWYKSMGFIDDVVKVKKIWGKLIYK